MFEKEVMIGHKGFEPSSTDRKPYETKNAPDFGTLSYLLLNLAGPHSPKLEHRPCFASKYVRETAEFGNYRIESAALALIIGGYMTCDKFDGSLLRTTIPGNLPG